MIRSHEIRGGFVGTAAGYAASYAAASVTAADRKHKQHLFELALAAIRQVLPFIRAENVEPVYGDTSDLALRFARVADAQAVALHQAEIEALIPPQSCIETCAKCTAERSHEATVQ
ncbi:Hypothetical protein UVM_LOCUS15 [uncultured virus]|nr:Hypothetical protein UVM_LOCUS15 [uncultured virus]